MKLDLDIAGTPAEVRSQLASAAQDARRTDPHANLIVSALNDLIGRKLAGASPDAQLVARVLIDISDATGLTEKLREFVAQPRNEVQRAQAAAIANERPALEGSRPVATVERIDGAPMVRGDDSLIHGEPTNSGIPIAAAVPGEAPVAGVARRASDTKSSS
jgi:hypothetical protein